MYTVFFVSYKRITDYVVIASFPFNKVRAVPIFKDMNLTKNLERFKQDVTTFHKSF